MFWNSWGVLEVVFAYCWCNENNLSNLHLKDYEVGKSPKELVFEVECDGNLKDLVLEQESLKNRGKKRRKSMIERKKKSKNMDNADVEDVFGIVLMAIFV